MKNSTKGWIMLMFVGLTACSSSKTVPYEAKWNAPFTYVDEVKPDQQDQKSRLKYASSMTTNTYI